MVDTVNQMHVVQAKNDAINRVVSHLQNEMQHLADLGRNFQQIQRELKVAESSFNQLLATRQELRFQMASQNSPWELMTSMDASNVAAVDNVNRKLVLSGVVAVLLGAAVALLQDKLDRGFHSTEEIMEMTKLPALATVPSYKSPETAGVIDELSPGFFGARSDQPKAPVGERRRPLGHGLCRSVLQSAHQPKAAGER